MKDFVEREGFSRVSLIIPQTKLLKCLNTILGHWPYKAIHFNCRGTVVAEHWFQALLPIMNPEMEYLQFIVKDKDVEPFMQFCVDVCDLHLPGSGAVFRSEFMRLYATSPSVLFESTSFFRGDETYDNVPVEQPVKFKSNLYVVFGLLQSGRTDQAIKAAMQAGSHGPIVYFVEGRGTRDRAGWLKITKKPYEEVVMLLVEAVDRDNVIDALVTAGNVGSLGSGVVFAVPVASGLVNLPTSVSASKNRVSNQQITAAIDELMGSTDWRNTSSLSSLIDKASSSQGPSAKHDSVLLGVLLPRKYANEFLDHVQASGIPGANVIYTKLFVQGDAGPDHHFKVGQEMVIIRMIVPEEECARYRLELKDFMLRQSYTDVMYYEQDVSTMVRYQIKEKEKKVLGLRGGMVS